MFPALKNNRIIQAAFGEEVDKVPVWVMRQAGRYLPEFREERAKCDFFTMCTTPEIACKVTLQPIHRFDLDAAIMFSDILVIPKALGMNVIMKPGEGPVFTEPLEGPNDLARLPEANTICRNLLPDFEAFELTRRKLDGKVPLFGFAGAPWTIMCYMIEGKGSKTMSKSKRWLYECPAASHDLLQKVTDATIIYLKRLIGHGAQVVFPKGGHFALKGLSKLDYDVIGIDWTVDPVIARQIIGPNKTLQGNLDPCALYGSKESIEERVKEMIENFGRNRYIANLGHGMYPDMDPQKVEAFVNAVHKFSIL